MAKRTATPSTPIFQPITVPEGAKAVLTPANLVLFNTMFIAFSPEQKAAVTLVLNEISRTGGPLLTDGYRKFFRFWRVYGPQQNVDNVQL
jgi:hypothetical protein